MIYCQDGYALIHQEISHGDSTYIEAEEKSPIWSHSDIGEALAEKWNLPAPVVSTIANHHRPSADTVNTKESCIIHIADLISHVLLSDREATEKIGDFQFEAWECLGLTLQQIEPIMQETEKDFMEIAPLRYPGEESSSSRYQRPYGRGDSSGE